MTENDYNKIKALFKIHEDLFDNNKTSKKILKALDTIEQYWEVENFRVVEEFGKRLKGNFNNYDLPVMK